jgi:hypothetical protein
MLQRVQSEMRYLRRVWMSVNSKYSAHIRLPSLQALVLQR